MQTYISEMLEQGIIHPSTSPVAAGFFLMEVFARVLTTALSMQLQRKYKSLPLLSPWHWSSFTKLKSFPN